MPCLLSLRDTLNGDAAKMDFATPPFFFDVLFLRKRRVIFQKTTSHFSKNDGSLFENDRSFLHNRRVVFMNTWGVENLIEKITNEYREFHL